MQAKKHRVNQISTSLSTLPPTYTLQTCIRGLTIRYARVLATARYYAPYTHLRTLSTYKWERWRSLRTAPSRAQHPYDMSALEAGTLGIVIPCGISRDPVDLRKGWKLVCRLNLWRMELFEYMKG